MRGFAKGFGSIKSFMYFVFSLGIYFLRINTNLINIQFAN